MKFSNNNNNNNTVKMAADTTKQVRVDNWAVFFLQRLQLFFSKTDYCDMTLQFNGNVQLKVHKLVINACTDYFQLLEQTCLIDENTILMPADLQADVIVPIINFMYTGMLEFQLSLYEKLYKTAQTMNITILTKLLEAQKLSVNTAMKSGNNKKKQIEQQTYLSSSSSSGGNTSTATKMKAIQHIDLPAPLPGRKLPIWKRKSLPTTTTTTTTTTISSSSSSSITTTHHHHHHHHDKWSLPPDPLSLPDNTPKPTRFEWPDDELPNLPLMDTSYESVSLTSKPLLTQEEEIRGGGGGGVGGGANNTTTSTIFDDLKQLPNASHTTSSLKTKPTIKTTLDMEEMKNYIKEQKIRSGLSNTTNNDDDDDDIIDNDLDYNNSNDSNISNKRKIDDKTNVNKPVKRVRFNENIDSKTTISVTTDGKSNSKLDHNKIVAEILKKYPQLVKENKNIRLKIMSKNRNEKESEKIITTNINKQARSTARFNKSIDIGESSSTLKSDVRVGKKSKDIISTITNNDTEPWVCVRCSTPDETVEFVLYYLYRKHMTDFHNEKFDARSCKYCGHFCNKNNILYYHLYIKHGMRPPSNYNFPKCNQCPYIALTQDILNRHRLRHNINEQQCSECKLAFSSHIALTSHIQITGHTGKTNKTNFDCQYCTKRYQSSVGLFIHVRMQHRNEAMRDGIVSIDEDDDYYSDENDDDDDDDNDNIDDNEQNDEYILPEIVNTHHHSKKVNILSNVKVTPTHIQQQQQQQPNQTDQQLLEPSSEAEALNNVASGIATSLGLVDIVVLNDNQQIYLQSTNDQQANFNHNQQQQQQQEEQQQENDQQTEFILPELSTTTTNRNEQSQQQQQQQVITADGVITQSMLTNNDIASTDELVMVLTDHDYGDGNQDEMNSDNSNIVVLYSHPVEGGQQEQYITSQGNIMVNSRTGMIEIRNSAPVCPSTNQQQQIVIEQQPEQSHQQHQQESHIESIEMIQREIESHTNDTTTNVTIDEDKSKDDTQIDDNGEESKQIDENIDKLENDSVDVKDEQVDNDNNKTIETTIKESTTDNINNDNSNNIDNQETVDDIVEKSNDQEILVQDKEKEQKSIDDEPTIPEPQLPEITDSTIEKDDVPQLDNSTEETPIEENTTVLEQDEDKKIDEQEEEIQKDISDDLDTSKETVDNQNDDNKTNDNNDNKTNNDEISNDKAKEESGINESNSSLFSSLHDDDDDDDDDDRTDKNQSNTATISDDDLKQSMKIAILDDWEDTDSQQSDSKDDKKTTLTTNTTTAIINSTITTATTTTAVVATDETVNKLMDDWADEDEDESKKE